METVAAGGDVEEMQDGKGWRREVDILKRQRDDSRDRDILQDTELTAVLAVGQQWYHTPEE